MLPLLLLLCRFSPRARRRLTPRAGRSVMDARASRVGSAALFPGGVSGFPGCSDTPLLLDGAAGSGSCQIRTRAHALGVRVSWRILPVRRLC